MDGEVASDNVAGCECGVVDVELQNLRCRAVKVFSGVVAGRRDGCVAVESCGMVASRCVCCRYDDAVVCQTCISGFGKHKFGIDESVAHCHGFFGQQALVDGEFAYGVAVAAVVASSQFDVGAVVDFDESRAVEAFDGAAFGVGNPGFYPQRRERRDGYGVAGRGDRCSVDAFDLYAVARRRYRQCRVAAVVVGHSVDGAVGFYSFGEHFVAGYA